MKLLALLALLPAVAIADVPPGFVDQAKAYLTRNFNDPDSAKYRDLYIGTDKDGKPVLCGEVNARNGRGGRSGFQAFYSKPGVAAWWAGVPREFIERDFTGRIASDYREREGDKCKKPGTPVP